MRRSRILVVEDDAVLRGELDAVLSDRWQVLQAGDGSVALELLHQAPPDLILLDHHLPVVDGLEFLRLVRSQDACDEIPIVFLTVRGEHTAIVQALDAGADDYLVKPVGLEVLEARVAAHLRRRSGHRERMRLERRQRASMAVELERSARLQEDLERFAQAAAHDLRTPLRMISCYTSLLEGQFAGDLDQEGRAFIDRIGRSARDLSGMVQGLSEFFRHDSDVDEAVADAGAALEAALEALALEIEQRASRIEVPGGLPRLRIPPRLLQQVFQNLVGNALSHGRQGGHIVIDGVTDGRRAVITVADDGDGVPKEQREAIFQAFRRGTSRGEGLGLGLALVKRILEAHGGRIWLESPTAGGARFCFALPAETAD